MVKTVVVELKTTEICILFHKCISELTSLKETETENHRWRGKGVVYERKSTALHSEESH